MKKLCLVWLCLIILVSATLSGGCGMMVGVGSVMDLLNAVGLVEQDLNFDELLPSPIRLDEEDIIVYMQGYLDNIYLGQVSQDYLDLTGSTAQEIIDHYEQGLDLEVDFFATYFDVSELSPSSRAAIKEMYRELYSYSRYEVRSAVRDSDDNFSIQLVIYPIDTIITMIEEDGDAYVQAFQARNQEGEFADLTNAQYEDEWVAGLLELIYQRMDKVGYGQEQLLTVDMERNEDGVYALSAEDTTNIDNLIIAY